MGINLPDDDDYENVDDVFIPSLCRHDASKEEEKKKLKHKREIRFLSCNKLPRQVHKFARPSNDRRRRERALFLRPANGKVRLRRQARSLAG